VARNGIDADEFEAQWRYALRVALFVMPPRSATTLYDWKTTLMYAAYFGYDGDTTLVLLATRQRACAHVLSLVAAIWCTRAAGERTHGRTRCRCWCVSRLYVVCDALCDAVPGTDGQQPLVPKRATFLCYVMGAPGCVCVCVCVRLWCTWRQQ
jgi:hypothetical protein